MTDNFRPFVKMCAQDDQSKKLAAEFGDSEFAAYDLPILQDDDGNDAPRALSICPLPPTRKSRPGALWLASKPDHEGERLHEYQPSREPAFQPLEK